MSGHTLFTPHVTHQGSRPLDSTSTSSKETSVSNVYVPPFLRLRRAGHQVAPSPISSRSRRCPAYLEQNGYKREPPSESCQLPADVKECTGGHHSSLDAEETVDEIDFIDVKMIGSYSWVEGPRPTIVVPGCPRVWREDHKVCKVKRGQELGLMDIADQNAYHCLPHISPWEPIFHAVDDTRDLQQLDIITDRGNLRKLFRLALGDYHRDPNPHKTVWRFDAEVVGSTVVLHRWETRSKRTPFPLDKRGFGVAYHFAKTCPAQHNDVAEEVTATQGLVRYRFGGLNLLVRFDIDAVLPEDTAATSVVEPIPYASRAGSSPTLLVKRCSAPPISHNSLLHIATRAIDSDRPADDSEFTGQLVFSQTPRFLIARHRAGDFSEGFFDRQRLDQPPLLHRVAAFNWVLRRVAGLLRQIVDAVRQRGDLAFICEKGKLSMYTSTIPMVGLSHPAQAILRGKSEPWSPRQSPPGIADSASIIHSVSAEVGCAMPPLSGDSPECFLWKGDR